MRRRTSNVARLPLAAHNGPSACALAVALVISLALFAAGLSAQTAKPTEYEVEAEYLSNFGRFVEWPATPAGESFHVCVLGQDPFGAMLDAALKGQSIGDAPMAAKRVATPEEAAGCRILFISASKSAQLQAILTALAPMNLLTVSDVSDFTKRGGMIQFLPEGDRVRFEINLSAAQKAGLTLSSELLRVATTVRREP